MKNLILSVKDLTVRLKKDKSLILNHISFELYSGDVLSIDGLNGSGKSTLLRIIIGKFKDYIIESGQILFPSFSDENILKLNDKKLLLYRSAIGYVPQKDSYEGINNINIQDLILDAIKGTDIKEEESFQLFNEYFKDNKRITLKSVPGKLSGGEQRMISIFLGLVCRNSSALMIIDEPLNNLDFENVMKISDLINEIHLSNPNSAMVMITHCKIITCINRQRKLFNGTLEENDSEYECHHCMGNPDCNNYYLRENSCKKN